ncbi:MAG: FAD-binding oxidoreductase [Zetaproteobacteria bacterium]|nr:FAD-binding oxidoreductase [Zetaproteobacteria bacterium]
MIAPQHIAHLKTLLPANRHLDPDNPQSAAYAADWTKPTSTCISLVLFPETTAQVVQIMSYCHQHKLAVVPSGGRTGLSGGANCLHGELVLSFDKMNQIKHLDPIGMTLHVEAGVTTAQAQDVAREAGLMFAVDLAAKGSSQIGGNIATNAGGLRFIRHGGMREAVLGLTVVLANGEILDLNSNLYKNNTGIDLKHLFIGSEGILGVVTEATLKLVQQPRETSLLLLAIPDMNAILQLLSEFRKQPAPIQAFEFFTHSAYEVVHQIHPNIALPLDQPTSHYVLLEVEVESESFEKSYFPLLERLLSEGICADAFIPTNTREQGEVWAIRERITESLAASGHVHKNDISVPVHALATFELEVLQITQHLQPEIRMILFGHVGDGNIHLNYLGNSNMDRQKFTSQCKETEAQIYPLLQKLGGSISAEHGIGLLKQDDLHYSRSAAEINWMKHIKQSLDPQGILNPGKLL